MTDPFDKLTNISTGIQASDDVQAFLISCVETGQSMMETFVQHKLSDGLERSLHAPMKNVKLSIFSVMKKDITVRMKKGREQKVQN